MLAACRVCARPEPELLHASMLEQTLTSESKLRRGRLKIHLCANCAHVMSDEGGFDDVAGYYGAEYDSLLDSPEADDLYDLDANLQPVYRSQIQLQNLVRLANLPAKGRLLDFGCGKGAFLSRFQRQYPGWELHGCDVSERYRPFVEPLTGPGRFAVTSLEQAEAPGSGFDLVTLFFVAEHLVEPAGTLARIAALLGPTGLLYLTVPNVMTNTIDAFLADHLSHFSALSLAALVHRAGLRPLVVSEHHQLGQITLMAAPDPSTAARPPARLGGDLVDACAAAIRTAVARWVECGARLEAFLRRRPRGHGALAVYGAGVFGSYLTLAAGPAREAIACYLDQSPFKAGKAHLGRPVVHPREIPADVSDVLVGLNPGRAHDILAQAGLLHRAGLRFFFP
ncbi:MAG: class I SAM-dependent methyltransferase [Candidatus Rokuibacteriota bacterium]|nr:MAG: class I SAM-dependent methyltransferase [Candidatus Rokubacteria bacterium]